jgi:hypothetical protein
MINDSTAYINQVLTSLTHHSPDTIMRDGRPVTRANRVATSECFQTYAHQLQAMIHASIITTHPPPNAWKHHSTSTMMDLTADQFPPLGTNKKPRINNTTSIDTTSSSTESTESLTMVDLDEIEKAQQQIKIDLQDEIALLRQATDKMQQQMQADFNAAMQQLELRVTQTTTQMIQGLGDSLQKAVDMMNTQAARSEQMITQINDTMETNSKNLLQAISSQIERLSQSPTSPNRPRKHHKEVTPHEWNVQPG